MKRFQKDGRVEGRVGTYGIADWLGCRFFYAAQQKGVSINYIFPRSVIRTLPVELSLTGLFCLRGNPPMKHMIENPVVIIVTDEHLPQTIPGNVRVAKSIQEAEFAGVLSRGEEYVEFREYLGLTPTGSSPWVVTLNQGDHQIARCEFPTLQLAIQAVVKKRAGDSIVSNKPKRTIISFIKKQFKRLK